MSRREILLAVGVLAMAVIYLGEELVNDTLAAPYTLRTREITKIKSNIRTLEAEFRAATLSRSKVEVAKTRAFNANIASASTVYQNWLLEFSRKYHLREFVATPQSSVTSDENVIRMPFTVQATARMSSLADFLTAFHSAPVLHRICSLNIHSLDGNEDPELAITIAIETIGFADGGNSANHIEQLLTDPKLQTADSELEAAKQRVTRRNMFAKGKPPVKVMSKPKRTNSQTLRKAPARKVSVAPSPPKHDRGEQVVYVGSAIGNETREAFFYDKVSKREIVVREGTPFEVAGRTGSVLAVHATHVVLYLDAQKLYLSEQISKLRTPIQLQQHVQSE